MVIPSLSELLTVASSISMEAGKAIMSVYNGNISVTEKQDASPLTEADVASHNIICTQLHDITPQIPILSEEDKEPFGVFDPDCYWLIDPLDGTKEFVKRNAEFTVNIALIKNGEPVLGVVYAPALNVLYSAAKGCGAYKEKDGEKSAIACVTAASPLRVVGSRSHGGEELRQWLAELAVPYSMIPMGSSLKICLVADGSADVYPRLGPTSLWDTAAAHAVVNEAGGDVRNIETGRTLSYATPSASLLNPFFIVESLRNIN